MSTKNLKGSVFSTDETKPEDVHLLVTEGVETASADGTVNWKTLSDRVEVKYSRAWLIVKRAWTEQNNPSALVVIPDEKQWKDEHSGSFADDEKAGDAYNRRVLHDLVYKMRDDDQLSWGDIAVRLGLPESRVRAAYRSVGIKKDLGLRIGKGGRYAYDDPTLYLEHRRKEGAHIDANFIGRPTAEQLLNFAKDGEQSKQRSRRSQQRARATGNTKATGFTPGQAKAMDTICKLLANANDPANAEGRDAFLAKAQALVTKHGFTEQEVKAAFARHTSGRKAS